MNALATNSHVTISTAQSFSSHQLALLLFSFNMNINDVFKRYQYKREKNKKQKGTFPEFPQFQKNLVKWAFTRSINGSIDLPRLPVYHICYFPAPSAKY